MRIALAVLLLAPLAALNAADRTTDVCVYGGTSSGLLAAISVAKSGCHVLVVEPSRWLGGMTGGGIRVGRDCVYPNDIGGLTKMMLKEDANLNIANAHHGQAKLRAVWQRLMKEHKIEVIYDYRLKTVQKDGTRIVRIDLEKAPTEKDGCPAAQALPGEDMSISAKIFIDASYEGDLMAKAAVHYTVGRESARQYGESLGGIRPIKPGQIVAVDPYVKPGDPSCGLLPMISPEPPGNVGDASRHIIAYNFRLNGEDEPIGAPDHFKPEKYELLRRIQAAGGKNVSVQTIDPQRYRKALLDAGQILEWNGEWGSREEWNKTKPGFDWLFPWIDKNKDGKISEPEFMEFRVFKEKHRDWENLINQELGGK